ncbi:hypothetical protein JMK10_02700, partial [Rhodovulum sulfidophilum]
MTGDDLVFRAFSGEASGPKLARATLPVSAVAGRRGTIYVEIDRTAGTVALWFRGRKYSTNPALCLRDYMLTPQLRGGPGWRPGDLDEDTILALANLAEEQVPLASGRTEDRYAFNGVLETEATAAANLNDLSSSWGGWWTCERGRLTVGGAAWEEPAFTVTEDMLTGGIQVTARKPFAVRAASIIPTTTVATLAEAPGFAGTATGCHAAGGVLAMAPGETRARYAFAGRIDLGAVQPVRLISDIELLISEDRDLFWQPSGTAMWTPPDARLWLGSTDAYGDVDLQVSLTDDAPETGRWGPWQSFDAADFSGRAFRFRAVLGVESPDYTIGITGLTVTALQA